MSLSGPGVDRYPHIFAAGEIAGVQTANRCVVSPMTRTSATEDGIVTSLEIYDTEGDPIALMFGRRKPGEVELDGWRAIVAALPQVEAAA